MNLLPLRADEIKSQFAGVSRAGGSRATSEAGLLGIRPEDFVISSDTVTGGIALDLTVEAIERVGAETFIYGTRQHQVQGVPANPGGLPPADGIVPIPRRCAPPLCCPLPPLSTP